MRARGSTSRWTPPTPTPEAGQGPWWNGRGTWWVVTSDEDSPAEAFAAVSATDGDAFPCYFAWRATIEPVAIAWVSPDEWNEEHEIVEEPYHDEERTAKAWRIKVEDA